MSTNSLAPDAAEISQLNLISDQLFSALSTIKLLSRLTPVNEAKEKKAFFGSAISEPCFEYKPLDYDADELAQTLNNIEIPETVAGGLLQNQKNGICAQNEMSRQRGSALMRELSQASYGAPDAQLIAVATKVLTETPAEEVSNTIASHDIKKAIENTFTRYELNWRVEFSDKLLTTTYAADQCISVCEHRLFPELDLKRLPVHEVEVHALRAANGLCQPLKFFAIGLSGYLATEEGLAAYAEEQTQTSSANILRSYAARVLAVDSMVCSETFRQTYERLCDNDLSADDAWNTTVRAFRGGGFAKDHIYLQGLEQVREFAKDGGDLRELYVGKIGIDDLGVMRELSDQGLVVPAKYVPNFAS